MRAPPDFSPEAVQAAVGKALAIARFTAEDPAAGLADPSLLARDFPDLDLYDPWELAVDEAVALGREAEAAALAVDRRLTNTEGATVAWNESEFVYANSHGFAGGYRSTRHHIDCAVIGDPGDGGVMQRDYWYTTGRGASDLRPASEVGRIAGERTVRRLCARKLGTLECPVLFEAPEAADLIGSFVGAVSGGALYRKSSFLLDSLGNAGVLAECIDSRGSAHPARPRQRAVRQRRCGNRAAGCRARRRRARLFPRQLLGAEARHGHDRQRRRQSQSGRRARGRRSAPR